VTGSGMSKEVEDSRSFAREPYPPRVASAGEWTPLTVREPVEVFVDAPLRWWISGGQALDLFAGRSWRGHDDTDVGVCRQDLVVLRKLLRGWDLYRAWKGTLTPWDGEPLRADLNQNNIWCRPSPYSPWSIDVSINEGDRRSWVYRRDPSIRLRWDQAVLATAEGIPYLAPDLQLLFKSKSSTEGPRGREPGDPASAPAAPCSPGSLASRRTSVGGFPGERRAERFAFGRVAFLVVHERSRTVP
jgi:hypothetical protein